MKWINVKDRLPEDCLYYLILIPEDDQVRVAQWVPETKIWQEKQNECCGCQDYYLPNQISHWMPLPEDPDDLD